MRDTKYAELYTKLSRLQWLLRRTDMQMHMERGPMANPARGQGRVLALLKMQPEIATKDLSYLLGIRQQSLNELLHKLEKGGYVERLPSEADRRVMVVTLTEKGKNTQQPEPTAFSDVFACLSQEEQANFGEYLDRIIAELEARLSEEDKEEIAKWMHGARSRMGQEQFEKLMHSRGGHHPHFGGGRHHGGENYGRGFEDFRGYGRDGHGFGPREGEDFGPDFDGHRHGDAEGYAPEDEE